jgi:hypothetical protein
MNWLPAPRLRILLLPLLLSAATVLGLGSYTETSDDQTLAWLFSGVLALKPVPSVPLYLHGYGHLLAAAYTAAPAGPWLGLLLGGLLATATVFCFAVLDRLLRPFLQPAPLALALTLFFGLAWLEHWLWFSHGRVALLLAGAGILFAAQRAGKRWALLLGLLALGAAWLVRPSLAALGAVAVVPAALLLAGGGRRAAPVLGSAALGLILATGLLHWQQTPAEARAQQRDATFSRILDYNQLHPQPRTTADSLGTTAVSLWLLGDSTLVNEGLFRRAYRFDAARFFGQEVPAKLRLRLGLLGRDYFPLLLALAATAVAMARSRGRAGGFWLVQLGFGGGLLVLAGLLKLPPRLALPLLDFWLLTNVVFLLTACESKPLFSNAGPWLRRQAAFWLGQAGYVAAIFALGWLGRIESEWEVYMLAVFWLLTNLMYIGWRLRKELRQHLASGRERVGLLGRRMAATRLATLAVLLPVGLYAAKTWHRHQVLSQERRRHESALSYLPRQGGHPVRILAGTNDFLKSLSPFRTYTLGPGPVLLLTGWPAHDISQARLRQALTGTQNQTECLRRLVSRSVYSSPPEAVWLLTPATARWLSRRFRYDGPRVLFQAQGGPIGRISDVRAYYLQGWPNH